MALDVSLHIHHGRTILEAETKGRMVSGILFIVAEILKAKP